MPSTTEVIGLNDPTPFHIENTLLIHDSPLIPIDKTALRNLLFNAYTFVSNLIDVAGDGFLPPPSDPYEVMTRDAYIKIANAKESAHGKLKWSNVRDVLLSLREYMVVQ